jgi:hypothetical protein
MKTDLQAEMLTNLIVSRLNELIEHPGTRLDISALVNTRVGGLCAATIEHPTIQITDEGTLGVLGLLNGVLGLNSEGKAWLTGVFEPEGNLVRFERTGCSSEVQPQAIDIRCPTCLAKPGTVCRDENGEPTSHLAREEV